MNSKPHLPFLAVLLSTVFLGWSAGTNLFGMPNKSSLFIEVSRSLRDAEDDQENNKGSSGQDNQNSNDTSDSGSSSHVTLPLKWKYGWADSNRANTVGSALNSDPLPKATYYLSTGYLPWQISNAYTFNYLPANDTGSGQTIALIECFGSTNLQSDLNIFNASNNLPPITVNSYYPLGQTNATDYSWAAETTLDVEWAHAMAPGATICVVAAPDNTVDSLMTCVDYAVKTLKANIVSMSWGAGEFKGETSYDYHFTNKTVTFVAAAGDNRDTNWPSTSPYVLAVGGTTMICDTNNGQILSETAWDGSKDLGIYGPGWGGGGGFSKYEKKPQYQTLYSQNLKTPFAFTNTFKSVPDVSYNADPYTGYSVYFTPPGATNGGWYVFGGTSAGTPQWAACVSRCLWTTTKPGQLNFIFDVYMVSIVMNNDITTGSNGIYPTLQYYDLATGLGSPVATVLQTLMVFDYRGYTYY